MKTAIYQVITPLKKNSIYSDRKWCAENCVPTVKKYAKMVNADYISLGNSLQDKSNYEDVRKFAWEFKTKLLKHFLESKYDKFLFVDEDVKVVNFEENIFSELSNQIYLRPKHKDQLNELKNDNEIVYTYLHDKLYNLGVFYITRFAVEKLCEFDATEILSNGFKFPNGYHLQSKDIKFSDKPIDELTLALQLYATGIKVTSFMGPNAKNGKWHRMPRTDWPVNDSFEYNFIHYQGINKQKLYETTKNFNSNNKINETSEKIQ